MRDVGIPAMALAVTLAFGACTKDAAPDPVAACSPEGIVSVGESIPSECSFEKVGGGFLRLADLAGKPAVINFWAAWCTYCIDEMPAFQRVYASFGGRVQFVGADLLGIQGETKGAAETFGRSTGVQYPLIYDNGGLLYAHFSARLIMPVTVFVRADGIVAHRVFGPMSEQQIRETLSNELGLR
ncbi:MAG: TlpA family protein disulfide reductase [Actinomycetota bacterium]